MGGGGVQSGPLQDCRKSNRVMIVHCVNDNDKLPCYGDVLWFLEVGSKYVEDNASTLQ